MNELISCYTLYDLYGIKELLCYTYMNYITSNIIVFLADVSLELGCLLFFLKNNGQDKAWLKITQQRKDLRDALKEG